MWGPRDAGPGLEPGKIYEEGGGEDIPTGRPSGLLLLYTPFHCHCPHSEDNSGIYGHTQCRALRGHPTRACPSEDTKVTGPGTMPAPLLVFTVPSEGLAHSGPSLHVCAINVE